MFAVITIKDLVAIIAPILSVIAGTWFLSRQIGTVREKTFVIEANQKNQARELGEIKSDVEGLASDIKDAAQNHQNLRERVTRVEVSCPNIPSRDNGI